MWLTTTFTLSNPIHESSQNRATPSTGSWPPPDGTCLCERGQDPCSSITMPLSRPRRSIFSKHFFALPNGKLKLRDPWIRLNKLVGRARSVRPRVWLHAQSWLRRRELAPRGMNETKRHNPLWPHIHAVINQVIKDSSSHNNLI